MVQNFQIASKQCGALVPFASIKLGNDSDVVQSVHVSKNAAEAWLLAGTLSG